MQPIYRANAFITVEGNGRGRTNAYISGSGVDVGADIFRRGLCLPSDNKMTTEQGVFVDADHNSQMMLYALGGLAAYGYIYEIETVRMSIIQPRLENISTFECSRKELEDWKR